MYRRCPNSWPGCAFSMIRPTPPHSQRSCSAADIVSASATSRRSTGGSVVESARPIPAPLSLTQSRTLPTLRGFLPPHGNGWPNSGIGIETCWSRRRAPPSQICAAPHSQRCTRGQRSTRWRTMPGCRPASTSTASWTSSSHGRPSLVARPSAPFSATSGCSPTRAPPKSWTPLPSHAAPLLPS